MVSGTCPAPPPPRWGSHPARRVARYPSPTRYSIYMYRLPSLPSRPPSLLPPLYPWATLGWAALPSQLPHTSRPTLAASPSRTIYLAHMLSARGKVRAPARLPLRGSKHGAPFAAPTSVAARPQTWSGWYRKSSPCDVPLLCLPVGAVPAEQLLDLLDVGEEVRDQISPHLGGHRCVVRPLVHLGW